MTHALKTWPEYYQAIVSGDKTFEVRKLDRPFKVGDTLLLQEYDDEENVYTGSETVFVITYRLDGGSFGIKKGYCVLGIKPKEQYA